MSAFQKYLSVIVVFLSLFSSLTPALAQNATYYTYDDQGNLINDGTYCIEYNGRNLPAIIKDCSTNLPIEKYSYRPDGQRFQVERYHEGVHVETVLNIDDFIEIKINEITDEEQTAYYIHANGALVGKILPDGSKHFYHTDHLGSVVLITDESGQPVGTRTIYGPYGNQVTAGQSSSAYGYTGQETDSTGLSWYNSRTYNPQLGAFVQPDAIRPSTMPADLNPYAYVHDNPVNYTDPSGNILLATAFLLAATSVMFAVDVNTAIESAEAYDANPNTANKVQRDLDILAAANPIEILDYGIYASSEALSPEYIQAYREGDVLGMIGTGLQVVGTVAIGRRASKEIGTIFTKGKVNGRNVWQRNDIDPDFITTDPKAKGLSNLELMKAGRAPYGPDNEKVKLHHILQKNHGDLSELYEFEHGSHLHPNGKSEIDRSKFDYERTKYWEHRAKDFE